MTRKLSISVPDDVAAWLDRQQNVSSAITEVIRAHLASQRTVDLLLRAGFDPSEEGKRRWRERLVRPIPSHAVEAGQQMIGRGRRDAAGA
jgi:hypothetical protein